MTDPEYRGCAWPITPDWTTEEIALYDEPVRDRAVAMASATLEALVGGRVANCPITVRPRRETPVTSSRGPGMGISAGFYPALINGEWSNRGYCGPAAARVLLAPPVGRIYEVKVDGAVADPSTYVLIDGTWLHWTGADPSECPWPFDQNPALPDTEPGTMAVTYLNAFPVDLNASTAVGIFAREFAKAATKPTSCKLPPGVINIVRTGVTIAVAPGSFPDGNTGIREVDAFIRIWNPRHLRQAPAFYSPDLPMPHRTS